MPERVKVRVKTAQKKPTQQQIRVQLKEYEHGWCRTLGHDWPHPRNGRPGQAVVVIGPGVIEMSIRCRDCGTQRIDHVSIRSGELLQRKYRHPDGYLAKGWGDDAPSRQEWRRMTLSNLVQQAGGVRRLRAVG